MKKGERPTEWEAASIEPTSTSLITPTSTPATASSTTDLRTDQISSPGWNSGVMLKSPRRFRTELVSPIT